MTFWITPPQRGANKKTSRHAFHGSSTGADKRLPSSVVLETQERVRSQSAQPAIQIFKVEGKRFPKNKQFQGKESEQGSN